MDHAGGVDGDQRLGQPDGEAVDAVAGEGADLGHELGEGEALDVFGRQPGGPGVEVGVDHLDHAAPRHLPGRGDLGPQPGGHLPVVEQVVAEAEDLDLLAGDPAAEVAAALLTRREAAEQGERAQPGRVPRSQRRDRGIAPTARPAGFLVDRFRHLPAPALVPRVQHRPRVGEAGLGRKGPPGPILGAVAARDGPAP